jgi:Lrp/AsnC family transcriptional regulator for asnA, asnC and gidA|tara:strand:- start:1205 stop:1663 length:459 start_codon:yes stop_codon:yes gene_type:complete
MKITPTDKKILALAQSTEYCVPKVTKLAKKLKMHPATVHSRLKKLRNEGVLAGYTTIVNSKKCGKTVTAFMLMNVELHKNVEEVGARLGKIKGVQEVHYTSGEWDLLAKVKVDSLDDYYRFSAENALQLEGISRTMGIITPKTFKETSAIDL